MMFKVARFGNGQW